jgi:hypothetical protein
MPQFQAVCVERFPKKFSEDIIEDSKTLSSQKALFQKDAIWRPEDKGTITVTFGSNMQRM